MADAMAKHIHQAHSLMTCQHCAAGLCIKCGGHCVIINSGMNYRAGLHRQRYRCEKCSFRFTSYLTSDEHSALYTRKMTYWTNGVSTPTGPQPDEKTG